MMVISQMRRYWPRYLFRKYAGTGYGYVLQASRLHEDRKRKKSHRAHEFLGSSVEGKDVLIVDDMISSGESMQDVAKELKRRKARKVFICSTFGLFTNGLARFDEYYEKGFIDRILTTNLVYQTPDLLQRPYYINVDMSKYIALIIDNLNHDASLSELLTPTSRINRHAGAV